MATPYENVFSRFLSKITDFDLSGLADTDLTNQMITWLKGACPKFVSCKQDISAAQRDDTSEQFSNTLTELEEEIIASYMVLEWLNPFIQTVMLMKPVMTDRDFGIYSQANQLKELRNLKVNVRSEINQLVKDYSYAGSSLSGFQGQGSQNTNMQAEGIGESYDWNRYR